MQGAAGRAGGAAAALYKFGGAGPREPPTPSATPSREWSWPRSAGCLGGGEDDLDLEFSSRLAASRGRRRGGDAGSLQGRRWGGDCGLGEGRRRWRAQERAGGGGSRRKGPVAAARVGEGRVRRREGERRRQR